ncbi:LOG family protein [Agilicoccus flavus]|uniref:LOG family protein n=1 Tax=Agilicoccus flavus TaxID=2775968 RepID=UPI001CF683F6|nr:Rossmann fold nucleotide-binding protein [Agilicoccus flavus]
MEIESIESLAGALDAGVPLGRLRLQGLDLRDHASLLTGRDDIEGLVVLGGRMPAALGRHLTRHGAVVLPPAPHAPVDPYRAHLYTPHELYDGLAEHGYDATPDARAYAWERAANLRHDAYVAVLRATHDVAMDDALDELVDGHRVVGVMGGHAVRRGEPAYADAARLGHRLADAGLLVATGGGPGAMEAANLGAYATSERALDAAVDRLAGTPSFVPDVGAWARAALDVLAELAPARAAAGPAPRSVGIPTWFYGHEPPNVFCDGIAKFFSNAVREDGLLARCTAGIVVLPGAAGTVQEIFQAATPRYYAATTEPTPAATSPLVLVGRRHWTQEIPVWPALQALGRDRPLGHSLHLVDDLAEAAAVMGTGR